MSGTCVVIVCFLIFSALFFPFAGWLNEIFKRNQHFRPSLILHGNEPSSVKFFISSGSISDDRLKSPSLETFIQASTAENSLRGLAVYSNLTNACQPLDDVNNANIQAHKIALVTLVKESACTLHDLAVNAQNAGYSVLIYFSRNILPLSPTKLPTQNKLIILVVEIDTIETKTTVEQRFSSADRTNVDILCGRKCMQGEDELSQMDNYLKRLYYWFLVGPLITLEWLRRTKRLCWMSGGQQVDEWHVVENENVAESELRTMEEGENGNEPLSNRHFLTNDEESFGTHQEREGSREDEYDSQRGEEQPLLIPVDDENTRQLRGTGSVAICRANMKQICHKAVMCFAYIILITVALPIPISSGCLSFFRFDQGFSPIANSNFLHDIPGLRNYADVFLIIFLWWSPFQIFCFFLYSQFFCYITWTVPTNFSKLIRSDWFASNIYLVVLAVVVPYCTSSYLFGYFATYNTVCTVCNTLFIIIVNKHRFVTRYIFYIRIPKQLKTHCPPHGSDWAHFDCEFQFFYAHHSKTY